MPSLQSRSENQIGRRRATLSDVAARAGVSTAAASVVLNGSRSDSRVSDSTRERILEIAATLQYQPNAVARSLRRRRTHTIAFYDARNTGFDPRYPFFGAILAGLQTGCEEQQKDLLIHGGFRGRSDDDIFLELLNGQIDGLVLYARIITPLIERLIESRLPVVTVAEEVANLPFVGIDESNGSRMMARHLARKGYQKVLYRRTDEAAPTTLLTRFQAFKEEAAALGLSVTESRNTRDFLNEEEQQMLLADARHRPDVVACWSDFSADGVAEFCHQHGLRVPEDIAIAGFDGLAATKRPALRLTTIRSPWSDVARTAVGLLAAQCEGKEVPPKTLLPVELSEGDTT